MSSIRVLHLIDSAGLYGAERVILTLLEELKVSRYPGILGCIREKESTVPAIAEEAQHLGIPVVYFTMRRGFSYSGIRCILRFIKENNIQLVHSHGYKPNIYLAVLLKKNLKKVATVHGWSKESGGFRGKIYEFLDAFSLRRFDSVIAVSKAVVEDLSKRGVKKDKVTLIYNGLKISKERPTYEISKIRQEYGLDNNAFVIGVVGRLAAVKGHSYLIEAISLVSKDIKNCHLVIAGEGPLRDELASLIHKYSITERAQLVGYVKDIDQFLAMIDFFALPSLSEGLPISLLEAMDAGKPALASAVGGILEVITDDKEGVLVPPADPFSLAAAIKEIYYNKNLMSDMAIRGKSIVEEKFSLSIMAKQYLSQYSSLHS